MKKDIHPAYQQVTVTCACGNTFVTGSTAKEIHVEICSQCHPFYTGKQHLVDTAGRVDRFERMRAETHKKRELLPSKKKAARKKKATVKAASPKKAAA